MLVERLADLVEQGDVFDAFRRFHLQFCRCMIYFLQFCIEKNNSFRGKCNNNLQRFFSTAGPGTGDRAPL
jgi:hypothetical protein